MKPSNPNKILSIIIVNYNVKYFLKQCLLSVQKATKGIPSEIIIVDNHSTDGSVAMLETEFKEVILIANKENVGFSKANNQGVAKAQGEMVLILNPDTVLAENTLTKTLEFAKKQKNLGTIGVKFIDGTGHFLPECKRGIPTPKIALGKIIGFPKSAIDRYYTSHINKNEISEVPILTGAFMLMYKKVYLKVNGFDESYFMYGEDIDLSYKILKLGHKNFYFGKATIIHYKGESTIKNKTYLKRFYGAMVIFYKKHFKVNRILNTLMQTGIQLLYFFKSFSIQKKTNALKKANRIIYIGKNETMFAKIKSKFQPELAVFHQDIAKKDILTNKPDMLIFDMNYLDYKTVFPLMESLVDLNISFLFLPPKSDFLIGSDSKNSKGNIYRFAK